MASSEVKPWTRPHDWAEVVLGVLSVLAPLVFTASEPAGAMWALIVLGALIAIDGLVSLAMPNLIYGEGIQVVLGALLFISPWVMGYTQLTGASWTSWVLGVLTAAVGAAAVPIANSARTGAAGQH